MGILQRARRDDVDVASCLANLDRLEALTRSGLVEAPAHPKLDELTRTAAQRLHAPMAFVNVLDDRRQYHVSSYGSQAPRDEPVEASYCQHVVAQDDVVVITDSLTDDLVRDNPSTEEVRAYLGVPIRHDGHCLGSFCVVDVEPRAWTDEDLTVLEELAKQVTTVG